MRIWKMVIAIGVLSVFLTSPIMAQMEHKMGPHQGKHKEHPGMEKMKAHWKSMEELAQGLKTHTESIKGIAGQDKLIPELLKHQEMVDTFIGKMIELHQMQQEMMKEYRQKMKKKHMEEGEKEQGSSKKNN